MARRPFEGPNPNVRSNSRNESFGFRPSKNQLKADRNRERNTPKPSNPQDVFLQDGVPARVPRKKPFKR